MKKEASGPQRDEGTKWFSELSDKGLSITVIFALFFRYNMFNFIIAIVERSPNADLSYGGSW